MADEKDRTTEPGPANEQSTGDGGDEVASVVTEEPTVGAPPEPRGVHR